MYTNIYYLLYNFHVIYTMFMCMKIKNNNNSSELIHVIKLIIKY